MVGSGDGLGVGVLGVGSGVGLGVGCWVVWLVVGFGVWAVGCLLDVWGAWWSGAWVCECTRVLNHGIQDALGYHCVDTN